MKLIMTLVAVVALGCGGSGGGSGSGGGGNHVAECYEHCSHQDSCELEYVDFVCRDLCVDIDEANVSNSCSKSLSIYFDCYLGKSCEQHNNDLTICYDKFVEAYNACFNEIFSAPSGPSKASAEVNAFEAWLGGENGQFSNAFVNEVTTIYTGEK